MAALNRQSQSVVDVKCHPQHFSARPRAALDTMAALKRCLLKGNGDETVLKKERTTIRS